MDLTWAALFVSADGKVYGRYGGRDAKGPDTRNTLAGLRYAMEAALTAHRAQAAPLTPNPSPQEKERSKSAKPLLLEKVPSYAAHARGCVHCHQAKEILRVEAEGKGGWDPKTRWVYPLPENIGVTLDLNQGDKIVSVAPASPAAQAGVQAGDLLTRLNGNPIHSFADVQYALHKAPWQGAMAVAWRRDGAQHQGELRLADGWKKTNLTWRPSLMDLLPSLPLFGTDLSPAEKTALGLAPTRLAFRQDPPLPPSGKALGVREGDIILGVDGRPLDMTVEEFLGYVRRNYLKDERVTLNVIRDRKRLDLPIKLP